MNSKKILALTLALAVLLIGCGNANEVETTAEPTVTTEAVTTTETSIPGLEDSIFDDETEPTETVAQTDPTETTEPAETTEKPQPTEPEEPETTAPTTEPPVPETVDYMTFQNMSASQQQAYMNTFGSLDLFFAWYNQAKADYEAANPPIDVGDGNIDMGDLVG